MKGQIYGILGLMYTLAIGILLVVALVGTSKQFMWQSSAPLYRFSLGMLSLNLEKVKAFMSQERAYAVDRAAFYTGAFGGYSTFNDLVPKISANICGCPSGYSPIEGDDLHCKDSSGNTVQAKSCFIYDGKKLYVGKINESYWTTFPEKYFVYWVYDDDSTEVSQVPNKDKIKETLVGYMTKLFTLPDPRIVIPLEVLGANINFKYAADIQNISGSYIDVVWVPIGMDSIIINFPSIHPFINYMMKVSVSSHVRNNIYSLYERSRSFVNNREYDTIFSNPSKGILPTVIDENYVTGYYKSGVGSFNCNYTTDVEYPNGGNFTCSSNSVNVNNLGPIKALIFYVDTHYWDDQSWSKYYIGKMGEGCDSCKKPNYLKLDESTLEGDLPCTAEIVSNISKESVVFRINKFYGKCEDNNDVDIKCMMCAIISKINKDIGGGNVVEQTSAGKTWYYRNVFTNKNFTIKIFPLQKFNLTLEGFELESYNWKNDTFSTWIPVSHYEMSGSSCSNIVNGGQAGADSICAWNGFSKAVDCKSDIYGNCWIWNYNITKGPSVSNSNYYAINAVQCEDGKYDINDSQGNKFSVLGKIKSGGITLTRKEISNSVDDSNWDTIKLLDYACKAEYGSKYIATNYTVEIGENNGYTFGSGMDIISGIGEPYYNCYAQKINCSGNVIDTNFNWTVHSCDDEGNWSNNWSNLSGGHMWANWFCYFHDYNDATGFYVNKSGSGSYDPKLDMNMSAPITGNAKITSIYCNDSNHLIILGSTHTSVTGDEPLTFNLSYYPKEFIEVYQPDNYANQTEILNRICPNKNLVGYYLNLNSHSGNLILDIGRSGGSTTNYCLTEIRCAIK